MYKTNFVCTYKAFEDIEDDEVTSDMMYQAQFLQVFGLTDYRDDDISAGLELIKAKADEVPDLKALVMRHPYNAPDTPFDELLPLMFAYPLMDVFHLCLIDAFETGHVSSDSAGKVLCAYDTLNGGG
jgi:hypothetical protein